MSPTPPSEPAPGDSRFASPRAPAILPRVTPSRRAGLAVLLALACRPRAPEPAPEPRIPFYAVTPDRLYTTAPVGDGISFAPVTEKTLERRAGRVTIALAYPEIDLPDDDREQELAAAIREAAQLDAWIKADGEDLVGAVQIACSAPLVTTALVSLQCERLDTTISTADARAGRGGAPAGPTIVARTYDLLGAHLRPLTWVDILRPGVAPRLALEAALAGAGEPARDAWLSGQCAAGEPGLVVHAGGLTIWPDVLAPPCDRLELARDALSTMVVPNGLVARAVRLGAPDDVPADDPEAAEAAVP